MLEALVQMAPERVVMISCNSATMARDVAGFEELGYHLVKYRPADLFARTTHVECVGLLSRNL